MYFLHHFFPGIDYMPTLASDLVKYTTIMTLAQWNGPFNLAWLTRSSHVLLGYTAYHLFIDHPDRRAGDVIKIMVVLLTTRILSGASLLDPEWITKVIITIIGYIIFNWILYDYLQLGPDSQSRLQGAINDVTKALTVQSVSMLIKGQPLNSNLMITMVGYLVYNFITSRLVSP